MKKFTKLFLSCTAIAALTASIATSAMAANKNLTKVERTAGDATDTVTITLPDTYKDEVKTLLILKPGYLKADGTYDTTKILQIGQDAYATDADTAVAGTQIKVPIAKLTEPTADADNDKGKYTVLMGGTSGDIYSGTFNVGSSVLVGDVNLSGDITLGDATAIVLHKTNKKILTDEDSLAAADCNFDNSITLGDATCVVMYKVNKPDKAGHVGETK